MRWLIYRKKCRDELRDLIAAGHDNVSRYAIDDASLDEKVVEVNYDSSRTAPGVLLGESSVRCFAEGSGTS